MIEELVDKLRPGEFAGLQGIERIDDATWMLMFDDESGVGIERRGLGDECTLIAMLGRAHVDRRFTVYETMLRYNALWRDDASARITLDEPDGQLVLERSLEARPWTSASFEQAIAGFRETADQWRSYVLAEPKYDSVPANLPFQHLLRA